MAPRIVHTGLGRREAIDALHREGLDVLEWTDEPGATYEEHTHPYREVRLVLDGSMTIICHGGEYALRPADRFEIQPGEPHRASVGPDGVHYLAGRDESG